jgi:hypothetical protein
LSRTTGRWKSHASERTLAGVGQAMSARQYLLDNCIEQPGPLESPCWIWTQSKIGNGYGQASFDGRQRYAHHLSYETFVSPIPDQLWVLHHCDNPPCINPDHLYPGTAADNTADMIARGRRRCKCSPKLTEADVLAIREMAANGQRISKIAKQFRVYRGTVRGIVQGTSRGDVGGLLTNVGRPEKTSCYIGVSFDKRYGTWSARVGVKGEYLHLGTFYSELDAARAYNDAVIQHNLNRPLNEL